MSNLLKKKKCGCSKIDFVSQIEAVTIPEGTKIILTATPSVGVVNDYTYDWSVASENTSKETDNPTLLTPFANTLEIQNGGVTIIYGLIKVNITHITTGTIRTFFFMIGLAALPA